MTPTQLHSPTRIAVVAAASRWDLVVTGELDLASGQELVDVARVLASYRVPAAELDLGGVVFVDSAGLQAVDEALAVLAAAGTLARVRRSLLRENKTVPGITALGRGEWVSVDPAQLESPTTLQSQGDRVVTAMREALESATRFQLIRASAGRGEYEATVVARAFLTRLSTALKGVTNPAGGPPFGAVIHGMVRGVPAGTTVVVHLLVLDGRLSEVRVDLGQWSRAPRPTLPLVLRISPAGPVTAPAHSVAIDVTPLAKQLKGGSLAPRWVRGLVAGPALH